MLEVGWDWERTGGKFLGMIYIFYIMIRVWVTQLCAFVKTFWTVYLRCIYFSICKIYLDYIKENTSNKELQRVLCHSLSLSHTHTHTHTKPLRRIQGHFLSSEHLGSQWVVFPYHRVPYHSLFAQGQLKELTPNNGAWIKQTGACGFCRPHSLLSSSLLDSLTWANR